MCEFCSKFQTTSVVSAWRSTRVLDILLGDLHPTPRIFDPPDDGREAQNIPQQSGRRSMRERLHEELKRLVGRSPRPVSLHL